MQDMRMQHERTVIRGEFGRQGEFGHLGKSFYFFHTCSSIILQSCKFSFLTRDSPQSDEITFLGQKHERILIIFAGFASLKISIQICDKSAIFKSLTNMWGRHLATYLLFIHGLVLGLRSHLPSEKIWSHTSKGSI